jgi:hypothetical protein
MFSLALAAVLLGPAVARADVSECGDKWGGDADSIHMRVVTYLGPFNSNGSDLRADWGDPSHTVRLRGWLYYKEDSLIKNERVLVYNHGHNQERSEPCELAQFFVNHGFVFFAPLRRGHFGDGVSSTGVHIDAFVEYCRAVDVLDPRCGENHSPSAIEVGYLRQQREDVRAQLDYILGHAAIARDGSPAKGKLANPRQVAILGHSYGGSLTVFANAVLDAQNVAIVVSGAELSWGDDEPYWENYLSDSMHSQNRPVYFLQPKNGRTLTPTKKLFGIACDEGYRSQAAIFPPVTPDATDPDPEFKQAHEKFIGRQEYIQQWGPSVVEFIKRYPHP